MIEAEWLPVGRYVSVAVAAHKGRVRVFVDGKERT